MKFIFVCAALLAWSAFADAKGPTARIEITQGRHQLVTLGTADTAGQFTIWSGPGTDTVSSTADFADWKAGVVDPPSGMRVYQVRFYCAATGEATRESVPSHLCYGVRYGIDPSTRDAYIQVPPEHDRDFPDNTRSIYRGVEGKWYRASSRWEELVRPRLDAAYDAGQRDAYRDQRIYQQPIYQPPTSHTAVGAQSALTPKK